MTTFRSRSSLFPNREPFISCRRCHGYGIVPWYSLRPRTGPKCPRTCPKCAKAYREIGSRM